MTYPTVFGNLAAGNQPASLFDTMFNIGGQQGNIPTTATGTNAITLVSKTNYYVGAAYTDGQLLSFQAAATTTGSGTLQWSGLGFLKLFTAAGVQVGSGDVVINVNYVIQYRANLDTGTGGFIILNATVTAIANAVQGSHKNVRVTNGGSPATQVALTADAVIVQNAGGGTVRITSLSVTISTATTGANALDTGTVAVSTFYSVWAIFNSTSSTAAGLLSLSATAPTLPSGYTYQARLGWVLTDGSANLWRFIQVDRDFRFTVGTNPANLGATPFLIASATAGTFSTTSPTLSATTVTSIVPSTAILATVVAATKWKGATASSVLVAPNTSWGGSNNGPQGSNGNNYPIYMDATLGPLSVQAGIMLETTSIAVAMSATGGAINVIGWTDNI